MEIDKTDTPCDFETVDSYVFEEPALVRYKIKGEEFFEGEQALIVLLEEEKIFLNSCWWEKEWPEEARNNIAIHVNCNDIFAWGAADAETLPYKELENLYSMWKKDPMWGTAVWCIQQRGFMPQRAVYDYIKDQGIWDLDSMGLEVNSEW